MKEAMRQGAFWKGLVIGLAVGLIVAWGIWPVRYTQAYPRDLRPEDKGVYILLVAKEYRLTGDPALVAQRLRSFDRSELPDLLSAAEEVGVRSEDKAALAALRDLVIYGRPAPAAGVPVPTTPEDSPVDRGSTTAQFFRLLPYFVAGVGGVILLLVLTYAIAALRQGQFAPATPPPERVEMEPTPARPSPSAPPPTTTAVIPEETAGEEDEEDLGPSVSWGEKGTEAEAPVESPAEMPTTATTTAPSPAPVAQETTPPALRQVDTFQSVFIMQAQREQTFDDVFTIYDEQERTLGECGVAEAETLHNQTGHPTVMEIWLFDKQDTTTHQAFILSPWAARQPEIRARYEEMGPVIVARAGAQIRLTARTLFLEAEIKDVAFAQSGEGDEVFSKLALTITVYQRIATTQPSA